MRLRDMSGADTSAAKVAREMQRLREIVRLDEERQQRWEAANHQLRAEVERRKAIHLEDTSKLIDAGVERAALRAEVERLRAEVLLPARRKMKDRAHTAEARVERLRHEFEAMTGLHDARHRDWQRSEARVEQLEQALREVVGWIEPSLGGRTAANRARRVLDQGGDR